MKFLQDEFNSLIRDQSEWLFWGRDEDGSILAPYAASRPGSVGHPITYTFINPVVPGLPDYYSPFNFDKFVNSYYNLAVPEVQAAVRRVLEGAGYTNTVTFKDVIPIYFDEKAQGSGTSFSDTGDLTFFQATATSNTIGQAKSQRAGQILGPFSDGDAVDKGAVALALNTKDAGYWTEGGNGFYTILHEMLHHLGFNEMIGSGGFLKDTNLEDSADSEKYSVMSYRGASNFSSSEHSHPYTLQLLDIAALQQIWQTRNYAHNSSNDTYTVRPDIGRSVQNSASFQTYPVETAFFYTIWDGGGNDTFDVSSYNQAGTALPAQIDLRQGRFSSIGTAINGLLTPMAWDANPDTSTPITGAAPPVGAGPDPGNVAIAYYTVIENSIGTKWDDSIIGNAWNNHLEGGDGKDLIYGDGQVYFDNVAGLTDSDPVGFLGNDDPYKTDRAPGNSWDTSDANGSGDDILEGGGGDDTLYGGAGDDLLYGGNTFDASNSGADTLIGGAGNDIQMGNDGNDLLEGDDGDDILWGGHSSNSSNSGDDTLDGGDGNDTLFGGDGMDTLAGGAGDDVLYGDISGHHDNDVFIYESGHDIIIDQGTTTSDTLQFVNGETFDDFYWTRGVDQRDMLIIKKSDTTQIIQIEDQFISSSAYKIEFFEFYNMTVLMDLSFMGEIAVTTHGTSSADTINGIAAGAALTNIIYGYGGNDALSGGDFDDTIDGGDGDDLILSGWGNDTIISGDGNNSMGGYFGNDTYYVSGSGINTIYDLGVEGDSDVVVLAPGVGEEDVEVIRRPATNATDLVLSLAGGGEVIIEGQFISGHGTIEGVQFGSNYHAVDDFIEQKGLKSYGDSNNNVFTAVNRFDTLFGLGGSDTLTGTADNNTIDGGTGADKMVGGAGDDTYYLDDAADSITDTSGIDTVLSSITYSLASGLENLTLTGSSNLTATGNSGNNTLTGNSGANSLAGSTGDDTYIYDDAADTLVENASEGTDTVISSFTMTLAANFENLTLAGSSNLNGTGNSANNTLTGNSGDNAFAGGTGDDTYVVQNAGDTVTENASEGTDTVISSVTFALGANVENLTLSGSGNINATGTSTANTITGNSGVNTLTGGNGNDLYVVSNSGAVIVENSSEGTDSVQSSVSYTLSSNVENMTLTGSANINATGNSAVNTLTGNTGNNTLDGGAGADSMIGGAGDDTYVIDNASDFVTEGVSVGAGTDTVIASINYTLLANFENLTLSGSSNLTAIGNSATNIIIGNTGNNTLTDTAGGHDTLDGGAGADKMDGGAGNDVYYVNDAGDSITDASGTDAVFSSISYTLGSTLENLTLTGSANINATGNTLANTLTGNSGTNTLAGGTGNDTYVYDSASDVVVEAASGGTDTVLSSLSYTLGAEVENLTLTGSANINATGNSVVNTLTGNTGVNTLDGGGGADRMVGDAGDDVYVIDTTGETIVEISGQGTDTVLSSASSYILASNVENLTLTGSSGINGTGNTLGNTIIGNSGVNTLDGSTGADTLDGGAGADLLIGGGGDDVIFVDNTSDVVSEAASSGNDTVYASATYTLAANVETLILTGSANINATGSSGDNTLQGNSGTNTLTGGAGNDTFIYDSATDTLVENASEGTDTVISSLSLTLGANFENLTLTGSGNINATGTSAVNTLIGNSGSNTLDGGAGADKMLGGGGNDTYLVDSSSDSITENAAEGTDNVLSSATYTLAANVENLTLTGVGTINGTGNTLDNVILGNSGVNTLDGGSANDTLDGGAGADTMIGGAGDDIFFVDNAGDVVTDASGVDLVQSSVTFTLVTGLESLILTGSSNINATGNSSVNTLTGNSGNNTLSGGTGADTMTGGAGDDYYIVDNTGDVLNENVTAGTDSVESSVTYSLSAELENLTLTGASNLNATGNASVNTLTGNTGINTLDGGAGADKMVGGQGNDVYIVDNVGDSLTENASEGTDTVLASATFTLAANFENLTLTGTGDINATGNSANNSLVGNSGNNTLDGGTGNDTMLGGAGNDTYVVDSTSDVVSDIAAEGSDTVLSSVTWTLGANTENLTLTGASNVNGTGNSSNNSLVGNSGINTLTGGDGDDYYVVNSTDVVVEASNQGYDTVEASVTYTLQSNVENLILTGSSNLNGTGNSLDNYLKGNTGQNTLTGGAGNDYYVVDHTSDVVVESASEGSDTVESSVTWTLGSNVESLILTGSSNLNGTGNTLDNAISGNSGVNTLTGGDGNDVLYGAEGADTLIGGNGDDYYFVDEAGDVVTEGASAGTDSVESDVTFTLGANVENLTLTGYADLSGTGNSSDNEITGNVGVNTLTGGNGNDTLDGDLGADTLIGGAGDDTYFVDNAGDVVSENTTEGTDSVQSSVTYTLSAEVENLTLTAATAINGTGNASANILIGGSGTNTLSGAAGNDTLDGGAGTDTLTGGTNADTFVFKVASYGGIDTVTDFSTAQSDVLDIRDLLSGFNPGSHTITDWVRITDVSGNSKVEVDRDGTGGTYGWVQIATLNGVTGLTDEAALITSGNLLVT